MNTVLPAHPWRGQRTRVWCRWWCSIDFLSNCCSWIYIHFLSQTSPLLVQSAKWRTHFSLLLSWKAQEVSNEEHFSQVSQVSRLKTERVGLSRPPLKTSGRKKRVLGDRLYWKELEFTSKNFIYCWRLPVDPAIGSRNIQDDSDGACPHRVGWAYSNQRIL